MTGYVEGYNVKSEGEVYHPSAFLDPAEKFKYAGDPEKQAEFQDENGLVREVSPPEITNEQSNADEATSTVVLEDTEISSKSPDVIITHDSEANVVTEGPVGEVVTEETATPVEAVDPEVVNGDEQSREPSVTDDENTTNVKFA